MIELQKYRKNAGITQQELADATGIDRASMIRFENGTRIPSMENLAILARYFNISVDCLLGNEQPSILNDEDINFDIYGVDPAHITDAQFEEVKRFAQFVRDQKKNKNAG